MNWNEIFSPGCDIFRDIWLQFRDGAFVAEGYGRRYVAEGYYTTQDDWAAWGSDRGVIEGLLREGLHPFIYEEVANDDD